MSVNGQSVIVLCASLFYFRIPRALWRHRMEQLKAIGYNAIDVYFPWNYHELAEGEWSFEGERDAEAFLKTAKEAGLWVVARPGPYICSEWDGGALPAYLLAKDNMKLRDNDAAFLQYTANWFDRILPILRSFQIDNGGTVIAVQLENELDFYDCSDPHGYISALRVMARGHGLTVPLIACAGQGGLFGASGYAEGVVPTCNFYPDDRDPEFEAKVLAYKNELGQRGYPLLVTETNRSHFLLRRLLSCGVKLLGPYLQVSGTDFGFTNATNNWGQPLAFMTSDYDFGGMISPEGHIREEAYEGRLLRRILNVYGSALAEAKPAPANNGPYRLELVGGGNLVFLTNVEQGRCSILPERVPLHAWGIEGTIDYSTGELTDAFQGSDRTILVLHAENEGKIALRFESGASSIMPDGMAVEEEEDGKLVTLTFDSNEESRCRIGFPNDRSLEILLMSRSKALLIESIEEIDGAIRYGALKNSPAMDSSDVAIEWSSAALEPEVPMTACNKIPLAQADFLELHGIYRGYAWYEVNTGTADLAEADAMGILVRQGSDVVSVYTDGEYAGTITPGGASRYIPFANTRHISRLSARTEIWGHTNFDDVRLPALRLSAMKGIKDLVTVLNRRDITGNWRFHRGASPTPEPGLTDVDHPDYTWPIVGFGGWLSPNIHAYEYYRKSFSTLATANSWTLHFDGLQALVHVFINGSQAALVSPIDPFLDITQWIIAGERKQQVTLLLERPLGLPTGKVILLEGRSATDWQLSSAAEEALLEHAEAQRHMKSPTLLPYELESGGVAWLYASLFDSNNGQGWRITVDGANVKLSVFFNERLIGRLWLPGGEARPAMRGGSPDSFYLPGPWFKQEANELKVLLEAVEYGQPGTIRSFRFLPV
ncbi:beta-galactosidase [Cohnella silvisoli]|uniref:Beta-galactosidase n=1 Tax=Cohnella silvisoli TaxID=2873699 RepID=A0ABV1KLT1_9BACL|nr:beta-galactosidase [Cohnella silvisoli]